MPNQLAEVIIWRESTDIKVMCMYNVYRDGLISEITVDRSGKTESRPVQTWQFVERVQFAMFAHLEVTFKTIGTDYSTRQHVTYCRS